MSFLNRMLAQISRTIVRFRHLAEIPTGALNVHFQG